MTASGGVLSLPMHPVNGAAAAWIERELVGGMLRDPESIDGALGVVEPGDLMDPRLAPILRVIFETHGRGETVSLQGVADDLQRSGDLAGAGGHQLLTEVFDEIVGGAFVRDHARRVRRAALERRLRVLHEEAMDDPQNAETLRSIVAIDNQLQQLDDGASAVAVGFSGDELRKLRERSEVASPLPGVLDPEPHLHILLGRAKTGKSTFALNIVRAWTQGVAPWPAAPCLPAGRVLVVSREQPVMRLDEILCRLASHADGGSIEEMTDGVTIVARDPDLHRRSLLLLCLDDAGVAALRAVLSHARKAGDPFGLVMLDSLSRLKPPDVEENNNDQMTRWLDALEALAGEFGAYVILIHHVGHSSDTSRTEARTAGRGASAIAACAQVSLLLERCRGEPNRRVLKVDGNAVLTTEQTFEVCGPDAEPGAIHYFHPVDPMDGFALDDFCRPGEEITTSELARRLGGKASTSDGHRPSGTAMTTAAQLRERWHAQGHVKVYQGPKGAKMISRSPTDPSDPDRSDDSRIGEGQRPIRARHKGARSEDRS